MEGVQGQSNLSEDESCQAAVRSPVPELCPSLAGRGQGLEKQPQLELCDSGPGNRLFLASSDLTLLECKAVRTQGTSLQHLPSAREEGGLVTWKALMDRQQV